MREKITSIFKIATAKISASSNPKSAVLNKAALITGAEPGFGPDFTKFLPSSGAKGAMSADVYREKGNELITLLAPEFGHQDEPLSTPTDNADKAHIQILYKNPFEKFARSDPAPRNEIIITDGGVGDTDAIFGFDYMGVHTTGNGGVIVNVGTFRGMQLHGESENNPRSTPERFAVDFCESMGHGSCEKLTGVKLPTARPEIRAEVATDRGSCQNFAVKTPTMLASSVRNLRTRLASAPAIPICSPNRGQSTQQRPQTMIERKRALAQEMFLPVPKTDGIRDKVALVTGGADGIGLKCVRELLKCGAKAVMMADSDETKGAKRVVDFSEEFGKNSVAFIRIDASSRLLSHAFKSTKRFYKGLDLVVNSIRFKEDKCWEAQIDRYLKGIVLSTRLSLEHMGRHNGGNGGTLLNVASSFKEDTECCALFTAVQEFIVGFDRSLALEHYDCSGVKVLTICQATLESVGCDLAAVISKGQNGGVFVPSAGGTD